MLVIICFNVVILRLRVKFLVILRKQSNQSVFLNDAFVEITDENITLLTSLTCGLNSSSSSGLVASDGS